MSSRTTEFVGIVTLGDRNAYIVLKLELDSRAN
jgi:hypothetical protein